MRALCSVLGPWIRAGRLLIALCLALTGFSLPQRQAAAVLPCSNPGWFPTSFGLKDHYIFRYNGYYYLAANYLPSESRFAYARSSDLCQWETLPSILSARIPGRPDEAAVWAPFVYEEGGVYYLYYTGVTYDLTQTILLATTTNPSTPSSWTIQEMLFKPDHSGAIWQAGQWADCRDPTVIRVEDIYYLYYTGRDDSGGIVGLATATSPTGPWTDWGGILSDSQWMPESATVTRFGGYYYLFYHLAGDVERYQVGASPAGPWLESAPFQPGWAHEVWQDFSGDWYTSYLTDYTVTISPLTWDSFFSPPLPFIGEAAHHILLPLIFNQSS